MGPGVISADPALRVERRGSPLFHFLGPLGSLGSCCAGNGFWCCHNIRPKLGRSLICDNRSSQCPYCVLFSRLGSLTTVLTWLRSRACAGMQGWALCACVQTGFTHHGSHLVAVACMCSAPPTLSCNQGPWSTPPSTRPAPVGSLTTVLTWLRSRACAGMQGGHFVLASRLGVLTWLRSRACAAPPQPSPATKALGLPPRPPGQLRWVPPPPHRASFKKRHFSSFCTR